MEDNHKLTELFGELFPGTMRSNVTLEISDEESGNAENLEKLYSGNLSKSQLKKLGVAG